MSVEDDVDEIEEFDDEQGAGGAAGGNGAVDLFRERLDAREARAARRHAFVEKSAGKAAPRRRTPSREASAAGAGGGRLTGPKSKKKGREKGSSRRRSPQSHAAGGRLSHGGGRRERRSRRDRRERGRRSDTSSDEDDRALDSEYREQEAISDGDVSSAGGGEYDESSDSEEGLYGDRADRAGVQEVLDALGGRVGSQGLPVPLLNLLYARVPERDRRRFLTKEVLPGNAVGLSKFVSKSDRHAHGAVPTYAIIQDIANFFASNSFTGASTSKSITTKGKSNYDVIKERLLQCPSAASYIDFVRRLIHHLESGTPGRALSLRHLLAALLRRHVQTVIRDCSHIREWGRYERHLLTRWYPELCSAGGSRGDMADWVLGLGDDAVYEEHSSSYDFDIGRRYHDGEECEPLPHTLCLRGQEADQASLTTGVAALALYAEQVTKLLVQVVNGNKLAKSDLDKINAAAGQVKKFAPKGNFF